MDLIIRNGDVVTASAVYRADIGITGGKIVRIERGLAGAAASEAGMAPNAAARMKVYDATGKFVLPGAIDVHTHFDMPLPATRVSDDFRTGTLAAACGGITSIIDFANQVQGESLAKTLDDWRERAHGNAVVDYGFHMTITDARDEVLDEIPRIRDQGITTPQDPHGVQRDPHAGRRRDLPDPGAGGEGGAPRPGPLRERGGHRRAPETVRGGG